MPADRGGKQPQVFACQLCRLPWCPQPDRQLPDRTFPVQKSSVYFHVVLQPEQHMYERLDVSVHHPTRLSASYQCARLAVIRLPVPRGTSESLRSFHLPPVVLTCPCVVP
jgi:hypothetical protein